MFSFARSTSLLAIGALLTMSIGAGLVPYGGVAGLPLSLAGCVLSIAAELRVGPVPGKSVWRVLRAGLVVLGVLVLWAGTVAAATAVAGAYYSRSHGTPYTAGVEIVVAAICALAAPATLTFKGRTWLGWSGRELGLAWAYWLGFYPASVLVAVLSQPWNVAP